MLRRILCVDDEPNVLLALERQFRKQFEIQTAVGPMAVRNLAGRLRPKRLATNGTGVVR
jgi:hypothetical protein